MVLWEGQLNLLWILQIIYQKMLPYQSHCGMKRLSSEAAFKMTKELSTNVSKKIKNLDKNSAAFILQGAMDYLAN